MNKHILMVMDKESFTKDELKNNKEIAYTAAYAAAYTATCAAAYAYAADVDYWIDVYFKETGENKQDYIDEIKRVKESVKEKAIEYTQDMADNGELPSVGMECLYKIHYKDDSYFQKGYINGYSQDKKWMIFTDYLGNIESHNISDGIYEFKPLTPPMTLIDGECYQGVHKGNGKLYKGVYVKSTDEIFHCKCSNPASFYTNIQPLTVEVK